MNYFYYAFVVEKLTLNMLLIDKENHNSGNVLDTVICIGLYIYIRSDWWSEQIPSYSYMIIKTYEGQASQYTQYLVLFSGKVKGSIFKTFETKDTIQLSEFQVKPPYLNVMF